MTSSKRGQPEPELYAHLQRFRSPLTALIVSWGTPWADAAELAQDSFAEAYVKRGSCRGDWRSPDFFGRWLRGIARYKHRNWIRKRQRDAVGSSWSVEDHDVSEDVDAAKVAEQRERDESIRSAIQGLPQRYREVVLMRYYDDTPVADIAKTLGTSVRAVEGRLYQARGRLRELLEQEKLSPPQVRGVLLCL